METEIHLLVQSAQKGDQQAFARLYDLFAQRLFRFIYSKVNNKQAAEDILQDAFVKAWNALPKLSLSNLNFSAWLYKIAGNCANDYYRKKPRSEMLELDEEVAHVPADKDHSKNYENSDLVNSALLKLPLAYRQILEMRFLQEMTIKETAAALGKTEVSVRVLQFRALKKFKEVLGSK